MDGPTGVDRAQGLKMQDNGTEHYLERLYGPVIGGERLSLVLGFASPDAFRKAASRGTLPVVTFSLPKRRGRFAHTRDIIHWLQTAVPTNESPETPSNLPTETP